MKQALVKLARLSSVDIKRAMSTKRRHPLWNEEIPIEEELINLSEALQTNIVAEDTLQKYPTMHKHYLQEQRAILSHTIGLVGRMLKGERLPRHYTEADITYALTRLTRLLVAESLRVGRQIDADILEALKPFLSIRQRMALKEWGSFSLKLYAQLVYRRLMQTYTVLRQN